MAESVRLDGNTVLLPGGVRVRFVRTLRLPETGTHPLPPGLGDFPVRPVDDYPDTVPAEWRRRGGVLLPMYLREAMWLSFSATQPAALQVGVGKVCAVSGRPWRDTLSRDPQNYLVLPQQPWLDGINSGDGTIRQFVAVPLGLGATVEGQVTGEEVWGGIQLQSFSATERYAKRTPNPWEYNSGLADTGADTYGGQGYGGYGAGPAGAAGPGGSARKTSAMGLGVGGTMRQEVYADEQPLSAWRGEPGGRVFVHLLTPPDWQRITGEEPPASPVDRASYTQAGLPWFEYYDADGTDLAPADPLREVAPVGDWLGEDHEPWHSPSTQQTTGLGDPRGRVISDGDW